MLPKNSASTWYQQIVENEKSGNYKQKVLGLRLIFDGVMREMFPDISEQDFYRARIDQIFEVKKTRGEFQPNLSKNQHSYHQLRLYFNFVMHSKIEADEKGYLTATRRLSSLINFCSQLEVPTEVSTIYAGLDNNTHKPKPDRHRDKPLVDKTNSKIEAPAVVSTPLTLCLIVDRRIDLLNSQLIEIENGIKKITQNAANDNFNFVVFTIKRESSILAFPISEKKNRFSFNCNSEDEQIKPLRDYLVNLKPEIQYHFFLTRATDENEFRIPVSLNDSSFLMNIGIVEKGSGNTLSDSRNSSNFDKLILDSNLPSFFDWIVKIINNG